ncbi:Arc-like DNA binding domain [Pragia fontium]|nr:Arc family DNA-binding protein [Pragia fontium]AKJ41803.1 hypothetical protein QQ39_06665 [Pragia fontium]VEJ54641.1 Arc-like DNA binding domain [Pragia fontium]
MSRDDPQLRIRLPAEIKDKIESLAKKNKRSMNAEIVLRLDIALKMAEDPSNLMNYAEENSPVTHIKGVALDMLREEMEKIAQKSISKITDKYLEKLKEKAVKDYISQAPKDNDE